MMSTNRVKNVKMIFCQSNIVLMHKEVGCVILVIFCPIKSIDSDRFGSKRKFILITTQNI